MEEINIFKYRNIWIKWKEVKIGKKKVDENLLKTFIDDLFNHFSNMYLNKIEQIDFTQTNFKTLNTKFNLTFLIDNKKAFIDFLKKELTINGKKIIRIN